MAGSGEYNKAEVNLQSAAQQRALTWFLLSCSKTTALV